MSRASSQPATSQPTASLPAPPLRRLRYALAGNAAFSALCGLECLLAGQAVASFTGIPKVEITAIGIQLTVFAAFLIWLLTRDLERPWARATVGVVIALDVLWVAGSAILLLMPSASLPFDLTTAGAWTVALTAAVVAELAYFQWTGWRGLGRQALAPA